MKNNLILLTAGFPYGNQESFLENEVNFLAQNFDKITFVSINADSKVSRVLPSNASVKDLKVEVRWKEKVQSFKYAISWLFWKEVGRVVFTYKKAPRPGIVATILVSLSRSEKIKNLLLNEIVNIHPKDEQLVFYSYWCDDSALALARLKKTGVDAKMISRAHGWDLYFEPSAFHYLPYRGFIAEQLDFICPVSKFGVNYLLKNWKIKNENKIQEAYLGVNKSERLTSANENAPYTLISCSNCIPLKRIHILIEALSQCSSTINWVHFGNGPLLEDLKSQASKELPAHVKFEFKGRISNKELLSWYSQNNVDLLINVSETEGLPVSMMEISGQGVPLLATDVGGVSEIVEDGVSGYLLKKDLDALDLTKAIERFFKLTSEERRAMGEASLKIWEERFDAEKNYHSFVQDILS